MEIVKAPCEARLNVNVRLELVAAVKFASCAIEAVTKHVPEDVAVRVGVVEDELDKVHPDAVSSATE